MVSLPLLGDPLATQIATLMVLGVGLILFMRDRFRYDVVALFLMIVVVTLGLVPYEEALANFGHPAVIVVASMFVISQALANSGIVDTIVSKLTVLYHRPVLALLVLVVLVAGISGFVNNIGALAMVIPIALHLAHKGNVPIAFYLLPLAFASHLGGYLTLIGTPRNILISDFRESALGEPFAMFDFFAVGGYIALAGITFVVLYAWRFFPRQRETHIDGSTARAYLTEVRIPEHAKVAGLTIEKFQARAKGTVALVSIFRNRSLLHMEPGTILHADDVLILRGSDEALTLLIEKLKLELTGIRAQERVTNADDYASFEVVVPPYARMVGRTWDDISLKDRFGTNFIGLFRRNFVPPHLLSDTKIIGNDILLLQGRRESVLQTIETLGLLPVASENVHLGRTTTIIGTLSIFLLAILIASLGTAPIAMVFLVAVAALIGTNLITLKAAYDSVDWPVLVLLASMITLGEALIGSGAAASLATGIVALSDTVGPVAILATVLIASMMLSDFVNTTASAVIMGPIAIMVAQSLGVSIDPFLMAVAIGASSAYLTPVGHESNALVMQRGGYRFSDFTKIGLPLELIIIAISLPLILHFWPL